VQSGQPEQPFVTSPNGIAPQQRDIIRRTVTTSRHSDRHCTTYGSVALLARCRNGTFIPCSVNGHDSGNAGRTRLGCECKLLHLCVRLQETSVEHGKTPATAWSSWMCRNFPTANSCTSTIRICKTCWWATGWSPIVHAVW